MLLAVTLFAVLIIYYGNILFVLGSLVYLFAFQIALCAFLVWCSIFSKLYLDSLNVMGSLLSGLVYLDSLFLPWLCIYILSGQLARPSIGISLNAKAFSSTVMTQCPILFCRGFYLITVILLGIVLPLAGCIFYAITFPIITTIAHVLAILMGVLMCWLHSYIIKRMKQKNTRISTTV